MTKFLIGLFVGLLFTVTTGQTPPFDEIDPPPMRMIVVGANAELIGTNYKPVIFVDGTSMIPVNSVQIGTFEISCMPGSPKNCRIPLKVFKIQ